jgi:hypothetical protein
MLLTLSTDWGLDNEEDHKFDEPYFGFTRPSNLLAMASLHKTDQDVLQVVQQ